MAAELEVDFPLLDRGARGLRAVGERLDGIGSAMPPAGDCGAAGPVVCLALGIQAEATALLSSEATVLGIAVGLCREDLQGTDAQQALDLMTIGSPP